MCGAPEPVKRSHSLNETEALNMTLTNEQLKSFGKELDALRAEYGAQIGDLDAEYIRSVRAVARSLRVAGRLLIQFSLEPISWGTGVVALAAYKSLENMEIGHNGHARPVQLHA